VKLDTVCFVETPEGIDLHAEVVGIVPRALAYGIDLLIRFAVLIVLSIIVSFLSLGETGQGILLISYFL